jgi:hypothetical protein
MKMNREIEKAPNEYRAQLQQRVRQQMTRLEGLVDELLQGVVMSDLTSKERLLMAARFSALHQRAVEIDDALEGEHVEDLENLSLVAVVRKIEAEKERRRLRIIDAGLTLYQENGDDGQDE